MFPHMIVVVELRISLLGSGELPIGLVPLQKQERWQPRHRHLRGWLTASFQHQHLPVRHFWQSASHGAPARTRPDCRREKLEIVKNIKEINFRNCDLAYKILWMIFI